MTGYITEIKFSKKKTVRMMLLATIMVTGAWFVISISGTYTGYKMWLAKISGVAGIIFFGAGFFIGIYRLVNSRPALIIGSDGFFNNAGIVKGRFIGWEEVEGFTRALIKRQEFLYILLRENRREKAVRKGTRKTH